MPTFTVHEPLPRKTESRAAPERFVFVRDGFYFWAFALAPVWLLVKRLWLAFFIFVALVIVAAAGLRLVGAPPFVQSAVALAVMLLVGFEASTIRRWTLTRRGWKNLGFVIGENVEMAERRFFAAWAESAPERADDKPSIEPSYTAPVRRGPPSPSDVIGLFPEPGAPPGIVR
jgi:hypothetical protein